MPIAPAVVQATLRRALKAAWRLCLPGPVAELFPHLLRHACATHNYELGMTLWEVQRLLGHVWTTPTVITWRRLRLIQSRRTAGAVGGAGGAAAGRGQGEFAVKWNLRWAAAKRDIWRRADRILDEARETADPVHLVRLFGIRPSIAVKYVHAAHPDMALPRIR